VTSIYSTPYDQTSLECTDYQPIQAIKNSSVEDLEIAEDTECDSCVRYKKGQCEIYENRS
jgi:hypothetical protein